MIGPIASDTAAGKRTLFGSPTTDLALYGERPETLLADDTALATFRSVAFRAISGLLVGAGVLVVGVAWFGMKDPTNWTLGLLTVVGLVVIPYWWVAFGPCRAANIPVSLAAIPPFMWVPGLLMPAASLLGWIATIRS